MVNISWPRSSMCVAHKRLVPRCVLLGLCPQSFDSPLRSPKAPIYPKCVGVGADLGNEPPRQPHEARCQRLAQAKDSLEARKADLDLLSRPRTSIFCPLGGQHDPQLGQLLLKLCAAVGEV